MNNSVSSVNKRMVARFVQEAKNVLKSNPQVKQFIKDLRQHFKADGWNLDYLIYLEDFEAITQRGNGYTFNQLLKLNNFKVAYNENSGKVVIKPRRKR